MIDPEQLANAFGLNLNIIRMQTEGLTHEDSLLQPPFRGNCLNWVLGHIATNRNRVLIALGEEPILSIEETVRYESSSEPITGEEESVLTLVMLLAALERAQEKIATALGRITVEELATEIEVGDRPMTLGQRLFGLYFHETYHTGQTETLRQLAGMDDKVI
ncbi:MAG: hypothetical protein AMJ88_12445 [Anaerolineae bacterium SM23_ 63]|nr:MAG: hypothetical protein AMJ88_12445 [Anaerolineae bacterium SM23_ 63]HEY45535.1 DUF664 domain-containing protein [Anaerolineae bacterium]